MLAQRATELANLSIAGMAFVQFAPDAGEPSKFAAVLFAVIVFWTLHIFAYLLMRGGGDGK
jgi:hypothetical protein